MSVLLHVVVVVVVLYNTGPGLVEERTGAEQDLFSLSFYPLVPCRREKNVAGQRRMFFDRLCTVTRR